MRTANAAVPSISIAISWPQSAPVALAKQLLRSLSDRRLAATWAVEEPAQADALRSSSQNSKGIEAAALIAAPKDDVGEALKRSLGKFCTAGHSIATIQVNASLPRGMFERSLCQGGVRAVVANTVSGGPTSVRPLPFGIWEISPQLRAPKIGVLLRLFGGKADWLQPAVGAAAVASIDLGRVISASSRGWREVERLVQRAAEACREGAARSLTIAELAAELSAKTQARPQRSILRMAA